MVRTRALRFLLILGLVALLIPVSLAQADGHGGSGTAVVRDALILGDPFAGDIPVEVPSGMLTVTMSGMEDPEQDTALEGWLISDNGERKQSVGILRVEGDGTINQEFVADPGENLLLTFNTFAITVEPSPDDDPAPSDNVIHKTVLIAEVLEQVRLLLDTSGPASLVALVDQVGMANESARNARTAVRDGDLAMANAHADCLINIVSGGDSEGEGECGDGQGIAYHADLVADAANVAGEAGGENETVSNASKATMAAANAAKDRTEQASAAAALVKESTTTQVATLHVGNVVSHMTAAVNQAMAAYTGTQDLATFNVVPPGADGGPSVGEPVIPQIARYGLIAGIVLALLGSVMFFGARRRSGASAA